MENKVALVEKYPSNYNYEALLPFNFDQLSLVDEKMDKVLKKDITLDIDLVKEEYDYVIVVGKEAAKFVGGITSVMEYQGYLLDDMFLALMNPVAVALRPSMKPEFDKAINDIITVINNLGSTNKHIVDVLPLQDEDSILKYLDEVIEFNPDFIALDTETSALYPRDGCVIGISMSHRKDQGVYMDTMFVTDAVVEKLQYICNNFKIVFHNAKFDIKMMQYHFGLVFPDWEDTMLLHFDLDENSPHGLKPLAIKYTDLGDYDAELEKFKTQYCRDHKIKKADFTYDLIPFDVMFPYAAKDTAATFDLFLLLMPLVEANTKLFRVYKRLLKEGTRFLVDVEEIGIPINKELILYHIDRISDEIKVLTESLYKHEEVKKVEEAKKKLFNVNSTMHLRMLFFDILDMPYTKLTDTGEASTDAEVLEGLSATHPIASTINNIKKLKKIKSTYLEKMLNGCDMDGRLRTGFNLHITTSGRLSSSGKINAQQLPRDNKTPKLCIEAKEGFSIVSQDLKTAEMYIASVLSGDKALQQVFIDKQDYHGSMAVMKFGLTCQPNEVAKLFPDLRQAAKTVSFEILYKLNYREPALEKFTRLKSWLQEQESWIESKGYIYSIFGRKRRVPDVFSPNKKEAKHQVRSAINFLVQSVSSDVNLLAGIDMQNWIVANNYQKKMKIWGLVHDSILAEVKNEVIDLYLEKLAYFTQLDRGCSIPGHPIGLDVEIGSSYAFKDEDYAYAA